MSVSTSRRPRGPTLHRLRRIRSNDVARGDLCEVHEVGARDGLQVAELERISHVEQRELHAADGGDNGNIDGEERLRCGGRVRGGEKSDDIAVGRVRDAGPGDGDLLIHLDVVGGHHEGGRGQRRHNREGEEQQRSHRACGKNGAHVAAADFWWRSSLILHRLWQNAARSRSAAPSPGVTGSARVKSRTTDRLG